MKAIRSYLVLLLAGLLLTGLVTYGDYKQASERRWAQMARELENVKGTIEVTLQQYLTLILSLEAFVHANKDLYGDSASQRQDFGERFQEFASFLELSAPSAQSLQLAPAGVIRYLTQMERNGKALGHDLLRDDSRRGQLIDIIKQRSIVVAGPLTLIQGGEALIVRKAIFTTPGVFRAEHQYRLGRASRPDTWPEEIDSDFWGFATLVVDVSQLYEDLKLLTLPTRYRYALRGRHSLGQQGDIFWGDASIFSAPDQLATIDLPAGTWVLAMQTNEPSLLIRSGLFFLTGTILTLLGIYALYSHQQSVQARAASDTSSRFLASMSHEIRTPMNGIIGVAQLLGKTQLNQRQKGLLDKILVNSELLLRLVNDVLDFTKIDAGSMALVEQPCLPVEIINHAISLVEVEAKKKNLPVEVEYLNDIPECIIGDAVRIQQILVNLISNAVKFTDQGRVSVSVKSESQHDEVQLRIVVQDSGVGISEKDQQQLFQPFRQVMTSASVHRGGTGLGLVISRQLARQMGGDISVQSTPGQGARFTLCLPVRLTAGEGAGVPPVSSIDTNTEASVCSERMRALKILVVDDMEMNLEVATMMLEELGCSADAVGSGYEAITAITQSDYDIIFMDRQMPGMDGLVATRQIRKQLGSPTRPWIIAMTASAQEDQKQEYLDSGANDFIGKPIDFDALSSRLQRYLRTRDDKH